jgi:aerobic-type carbon monoxide dehydrogenase small subunit (CoxS/CutS family)
MRAVSAVQHVEITTLEGLAQNGKLHPVQQAWIEEQVPQCGFCQNGQILTAKALLDRTPNPTDAQIREGMQGALCRCMTYYRVQAAVKLAARTMAGSRTQAEHAGHGEHDEQGVSR